MFDLGSSLFPALNRADTALSAQAATAASGRDAAGGMAAVAQRAIFGEALLQAIRARLNEVRNAARG